MNALSEFTTPGGNYFREESWCIKYLLFLLSYYLLKFAGSIITPVDSSLLYTLIGYLFNTMSLAFILLSIYINYKNKVWHFLFRLLLCSFVTIFALVFLYTTLGPVGLALWAIASIAANRKLFWIFSHYKKYTIYIVLCYAILITASIIIFFAGLPIGSPWAAVISLVQSLILLSLLRKLCLDEIRQGKTFLEVLRILTLLPASFIFFCISLLTIIPVRFFSKKSLFGEDSHDFIALPRE